MFKFGLEAEAGLPAEQPENRAEKHEFDPQRAIDQEVGVLERYPNGKAGRTARALVMASMLAFGSVFGAGSALASGGEQREAATMSDAQENQGLSQQDEQFIADSGQRDYDQTSEHDLDAQQPTENQQKELKAVSHTLSINFNLPIIVEVRPGYVRPVQRWGPPPPPRHHDHHYRNYRGHR